MTTVPLAGVLRHIRRMTMPRPDQTDAELVAEFVGRRDESAFEELMRRHGPMVWGVCRRALRHEADAEDAFQATFLVLVRKAASLADPAAVGNFLYGVAHNVSRKVRAMNGQRRDRERLLAEAEAPAGVEDLWCDLRPLLDDELSQLPHKYRTAVVLCDLEGRSVQEAARLLDCPVGTVGSRLARGRRLLGRRLVRQGLGLSAGTIALLLSSHGAEAGAPSSLVPATNQTAALVKGVLNDMLTTRIKTTAALVLATCAVVLSSFVQGSSGPGDLQPAVKAAPVPEKPTVQPLQVLKEAREAAAGIEDKQQKAATLRNIGTAQAQAGDKDAATQTFREVLKIQLDTDLPAEVQQSVLSSLAEAQAEAGDLKGARETAARIADEKVRDLALALIAGAQARSGDFEGARRAIDDLITKPQAYALAHSRLALALASAGKADEAIRAASVLNEFDRVCVLTQVAMALAKASARDGAAKSLAEAEKLAPGVAAEADQRNIAYQRIAEAKAEMGDVKGALQTVESITSESWKEWALGEIAAAQARAGDSKGALRTAKAVKKREDLKREALYWVIQSQLRSGDVKGARQTADSFWDPFHRAWGLARIAAAEAKPAHRVVAAGDAYDKALEERGRGTNGGDEKPIPGFGHRERLQCSMAREQAKAGEAWEAYRWAAAQKTGLLKAEALFSVAWGMAQR